MQYYHTYTYREDNTMKNLVKKLITAVNMPRKAKLNHDYLVWAKTEFNKDWQFAYQYMIDHDGAAPTVRDLNPWNEGSANKNLRGWV